MYKSFIFFLHFNLLTVLFNDVFSFIFYLSDNLLQHFDTFRAPYLVSFPYVCLISKTTDGALSPGSLGECGNTYIHISPVTISAPSCQVHRSAPLRSILSFSILCMKWDESPCQQSSLAAALENNEIGFRYRLRQPPDRWNAIFLKCCVTWASYVDIR